MTKSETMVSVITVNWNGTTDTIQMLESLQAISSPVFEVFVVDNGSTLVSPDPIPFNFPEVHFIKSEKNLGFAGGNNLALPFVAGKYTLLLNNDTVVPEDFMFKLVKVLENHPECGAVSPKIYFYNSPKTIQYAGTTPIHPITGRGTKLGYGKSDNGDYNLSSETALPNGACMLIRTDLLKKLGGIPELYFLYYEEHDLAEQIKRAGYTIRYEPSAHIYHKVSVSTGKGSPLKTYYMTRNRLLYIRRNTSGVTRVLAQLYFLGITIPAHILRHTFKGHWSHLLQVLKGLSWNLHHSPNYNPSL